MKRRLILVRHAKSSWDRGDVGDHDRPLNGRGKRSAKSIGIWLRDRGYIPASGVSSDSARTRESWKLIVGELGAVIDVSWSGTLYHASAQAMLDTLRSHDDQPSILMLGHNPGISVFANMIARDVPQHPRYRDYPTCATSVIDFAACSWSDIGWGSGTVIDFVIPRELGA